MSRRGALACPELDELAKVLPERDPDGRFFWQDYVNRITDRFDGLPATGRRGIVCPGVPGGGLPGSTGHPAQHAVGEPGAAAVGPAGAWRIRAAHPPGAVLCPPACATWCTAPAGCGPKSVMRNGMR